MELDIEGVRHNKRFAEERMYNSTTAPDIWEHIAALWYAVETCLSKEAEGERGTAEGTRTTEGGE